MLLLFSSLALADTCAVYPENVPTIARIMERASTPGVSVELTTAVYPDGRGPRAELTYSAVRVDEHHVAVSLTSDRPAKGLSHRGTFTIATNGALVVPEGSDCTIVRPHANKLLVEIGFFMRDPCTIDRRYILQIAKLHIMADATDPMERVIGEIPDPQWYQPSKYTLRYEVISPAPGILMLSERHMVDQGAIYAPGYTHWLIAPDGQILDFNLEPIEKDRCGDLSPTLETLFDTIAPMMDR